MELTLSPALLTEYLEILKESGVTNFSCALFSVSLVPEVVIEEGEDTDIRKAQEKRAEAKARVEADKFALARSLFPGNGPIDFPRSKH